MIHLNSMREVINHPDTFFSMAQIFWLTFSNDCGLFSYMLSFKNLTEIKIWWGGQIWWMRRPLGFMVPADQLIRESMVEPLHSDVGCMWSYPNLLEPLYISNHTMMCSKCPPELVTIHQCKASLWQWLPPHLRFQTKTVQLFHVLRWSLILCTSECKGFLSISYRASAPQYTQLFLLTCP